ncbi:Subtilisin NAT precursor [compost metagenome]
MLFSVGFCFSQEDAWVYFKDKPDAEYYLANPLEMLSQKALDRRLVQKIALDDRDVPQHQPYIDAVMSAEGITVMAKSKWLNALHIRGSQLDIIALKSFVFVDRVEFANRSLNIAGRIVMQQQNNIVTKELETQTEFNYGNSANQIQMLNGNLLHQQNFTGKGMTIAVLDAGFPNVNTAKPFQRLLDNNLIIGGYNFVSRSDDFYTGGTHGTTVLSTMGGYVEGQLTGTAPDAFYYLFVTEDPTNENPVEESYWVEAAERADSLGVDVINTSLGYFKYDNGAYSYTYSDMNGETAFITRGMNVAFSRGIFCVVSAGNTGTGSDPHIGSPADAINSLTVGAVDAMENYANFSSIGPSFDGRVKPDVMAKGAQATMASAQGKVTIGNGTSLASPITAGLVACLWQALPNKTNAELLQLIKESADRYGNPTVQYGYGIPDFNLALQNGWGTANPSDKKIILYPNPSNDIINLVFPKGTLNGTITIFNNLGQLITEKTVSVNESFFSISSLAIGFYSYRFESATLSQTGRIIKE